MPHTQIWDPAIGDMLADPAQRAALADADRALLYGAALCITGSRSISRAWTTRRCRIPDFITELYADLHARNLRLYVNVAVGTEDRYLKQIAANSDGIVLMNYDQHEVDSDPGPIAAQRLVCGQPARGC